MARLAWSQLRFAAVRVVALLAGLLLATTAFTVLTAASRTAQLRTVGTVSSHFLSAYQILVRPRGARTALEAQTGTVQPNFLAGAAIGLSAAAIFAGQAPGSLYLVAAAAAAAGVLVTATAAILPNRALRHLPAAHLLAAD